MVHYGTNSRNSVVKPSSFPARPLGMLYLVLPADCWYNFIIYNPNKLHCKLLDTKKFSCSIMLCNKYISELSLKITHNNSHNNNKLIINTNQIKTVCPIITRPYGN